MVLFDERNEIGYMESTIKPYKEREIDFKLPVKVYRNLNNGLISIVQNSKVVGHADYLALENCKFKVNKKSRERVIATKRKNVHAYMYGYIIPIQQLIAHDLKCEIVYNPYINDEFMIKNTEEVAPVSRYGYITKEGKIMVQPQ